MMAFAFQPLIEKLEPSYWGECDNELKNEFVQQTNVFSRELDETVNSMSKNLDKCKLDHDHLKSL